MDTGRTVSEVHFVPVPAYLRHMLCVRFHPALLLYCIRYTALRYNCEAPAILLPYTAVPLFPRLQKSLNSAIFSLSGILFPTAVCRIFIKMNPTLTDIANLGIRTYFFAFLPFGINLLTSYYLQAILRSAQSLCISLLRNIILSSICILVFPLCLGASSLWFVMPIVEVVVLFVSLGYLKSKSI